MTAITVHPPLSSVTDLYPTIQACQKDDTIYFKTDSLFIVNNGKLKCSSSDPQEVNYKWFLIDNKDISIGGNLQTIKSLSEMNLTTETYQKIDTTNYVYTAHYSNLK